MRRTIGLSVGVALLCSSPARAQRVELGIHGGYYHPTTPLYHLVVPLPTSTGFAFQRTSGRNSAGRVFGLDLSWWLARRVGIDAATSFRFSDRYGSTPPGEATTIGVHALRVFTGANIGRSRLRIGGGPALVYIGGDASGLGKRSYAGASLLADLTARASRFRIRIGVEDALYRVTLASRPPSSGDSVSIPVQHDLMLTLGFVLPLR